MFISFKNYTSNNLPLLIFSNKIFFKFKSRNFILFYSQYYNTYINYFNKSIIYYELNINALFDLFFKIYYSIFLSI